MELNDQVTIVLTETGAKILNKYNVKMQQLSPTLNLDIVYKAGDVYRDQLWSLFNVFKEDCCIGGTVIFTNLELSNSL